MEEEKLRETEREREMMKEAKGVIHFIGFPGAKLNSTLNITQEQ